MAKTPEVIDHIGTSLIRASDAWKARYAARMAEAGFPAAGEGRGALLAVLGPSGLLQSQFPDRCGITKQAVAQHLDQLEREGLIRREPVPEDGRVKRVLLTEEGHRLHKTANRVRRKIEADLVAGLDGVTDAELRGLLDWMAAQLADPA